MRVRRCITGRRSRRQRGPATARRKRDATLIMLAARGHSTRRAVREVTDARRDPSAKRAYAALSNVSDLCRDAHVAGLVARAGATSFRTRRAAGGAGSAAAARDMVVRPGAPDAVHAGVGGADRASSGSSRTERLRAVAPRPRHLHRHREPKPPRPPARTIGRTLCRTPGSASSDAGVARLLRPRRAIATAKCSTARRGARACAIRHGAGGP